MHLILLWALVALIGQVKCKCSLAPILNDERSTAYVCTHGDLNDLDEISSDADWIEFTVSRFNLLPDNALWRFRNLRRLSFYNCHVNFISPDAFAGLDSLEWLIFHGTKIHVARAVWFRPLTNLRRLILDRCGLVHVEPDLFRMLPRLEVLGLRDNDLNCLPIDELLYLRSLKTVRVDGNPWLCECRRKLDQYLRSRSIVQEVECLRQINVCKKYQCMTPIGFPVLPSTLTTQRLHDFDRERTLIRGNEFQTNVFTSLDRLPDKTSWIEVSGLRIDTLPRYAFFRFGNSLTTLELIDCGITAIENGAFAGLHKLERLSLVGNRLPVVGANWFRDLVSLQQLILERNGMQQIERTALWHVGDSLRHLDVQYNLFRCIPVEELADLSRLEFRDCGIERIEPRAFSNLRNLEYLSLRSNQLESISSEMVYGLHNLRRLDLSFLDVSNNPWSCLCGSKLAEFLDSRRMKYDKGSLLLKEDCYATAGSPEVATSPPVPVTTSATLGNEIVEGTCTIDEDTTVYRYRCTGGNLLLLQSIPSEVTAIEFNEGHLPRLPSDSLAKFANLRELVIRNSGLTTVEDGAFNDLKKLENLTIQDNPLEMIGSSWFVLPNLDRLDLRGNSIKHIESGSFRYLNRLAYLNLEGNDLRCIFTSDLNEMSNVYIVEFSGNPLKWRCRVELEQFLEARKIRFVTIENSCEGKKLVRNLLLQNKTDGSFDCTSECSVASTGRNFFVLFILSSLITLVH